MLSEQRLKMVREAQESTFRLRDGLEQRLKEVSRELELASLGGPNASTHALRSASMLEQAMMSVAAVAAHLRHGISATGLISPN